MVWWCGCAARLPESPDPARRPGVFIPIDLIVWSSEVPIPQESMEPGAQFAGETDAEHPPLHSGPELFSQPYRNGSAQQEASSLPRRDPGASGIIGAHDAPVEPEAEPSQPADASAFFSARGEPSDSI